MINRIKNFEVSLPKNDGGISVVDSIKLKKSCEDTIFDVLKYFEEETGLSIHAAHYWHKSETIGNEERFVIDVKNPYCQHTIDEQNKKEMSVSETASLTKGK